MPMRLSWQLVALAVWAAGVMPACSASGGCHVVPHCEGNDLHSCAGDTDTGMTETRLDCSADGRVCRQGGGGTACVFADQPCTADACSGDRIARCASLGLVASYFDCAADEPGRTCFDGANGPTCGYPAVPCPPSGADTLCGSDGFSLYRSCTSQAHPLHREDCSAFYGNVCTTVDGTAGCALPAFIPCTRNERLCSSDLTHAYGCGALGLVSEADDCAVRGEICLAGGCGFDVPCDLSLTDSWCADGSTFYSCAANGFASARGTCAPGKRCTEHKADGRTFAGCQ